MCSSSGRYDCRYADDDGMPLAKHVSPDGRSHLASQPHAELYPHRVDSSSTKTPTSEPRGIFDERKSRYAGASAAMAFPHILGSALGSYRPPKMRSFAYNFGIRPEEASSTHCLLGRLISEEDLGFFSNVYFSVLSPIGDVLDPRIYAQRCRDYYHQSSGSVPFAAVAAGVASLGSLLSPNRHPRESDMV